MACNCGCNGASNGCGALAGLATNARPRHLTDEETRAFLDRWQYTEPVRSYLAFQEPPWGITVEDGGREFLVWFDAPSWWTGERTLHVVDVTGDPIVDAVNKPEFEAPGYVDILVDRVNEVVGNVSGVVHLALVAFIVYGAIRLTR